MKDVFISGWCGYPELFGEFADEFEFVVPSITHSLQDISDLMEDGGRNLFAWSTGAYIVLDQSIKPDFDNIVLAAPFEKFTKYTPERVLEKMLKRFVEFPEKVIADFFKRCQSPQTPAYDERHFHILMHQLKYLIRTDIQELNYNLNGMKCLHGVDDVIVNIEASRDIQFKSDCELVELNGVGHFIPAEILKQYKI